MRLPTLSLLLVLLLAAAGCSDLPSADESTAGMNPSVVITFEGDKTETRYSAEYLRRMEVQREATKTVIVQQALQQGDRNEYNLNFQAYAEVRAGKDRQFAEQIAIIRDDVERAWTMTELDPSRDINQHRTKTQHEEYVHTLLHKYNISYAQLRDSVPDEFQIEGLSPTGPADAVDGQATTVGDTAAAVGTQAATGSQLPGGLSATDVPAEFLSNSGQGPQANVPSEFLSDQPTAPALRPVGADGHAAEPPAPAAPIFGPDGQPLPTPGSKPGSKPAAAATSPLTSGFDTSIPREFQN